MLHNVRTFRSTAYAKFKVKYINTMQCRVYAKTAFGVQ